MKYKPYPKYKDSGIEWLGMVPEGWTAEKAKYLFTRQQRDPADSDGVITAFRDGQVTLRSNRREDGYTFADKEIGYQGIRKGDLVIHAMDAFAGAIGVSDSDGKGSPVYSVCTPLVQETTDTRFYGHLLREMSRRGFINALARGIRERSTEFRYNEFSSILLPIPSIGEQRAIAAFLDRETRRIDELIGKKERQIELLQEKRQALISHAVTKGLDPNAKMKDSGIEWLGTVPEGWEVKRLKHVASVAFSSVDKHTIEGEDTVRLCNYTDVYNNDAITSEIEFMVASASREELRRFRLIQGDVLITKDSESWEDIAVPAYVASSFEDVLCGYHLAHIRPNQVHCIGEYLFRAFATGAVNYQYRIAANGITRFGLGKYALDNSLVPIPPLKEQCEIASFLNAETSRMDGTSDRIRASIATLREYRTALISAAVTGKIDVRGEE